MSDEKKPTIADAYYRAGRDVWVVTWTCGHRQEQAEAPAPDATCPVCAPSGGKDGR